MGWTKRAILGFAVIAPLKDIIGYGPWGRAANKQVALQTKLTALGFEERRRLAAWVDRLDDKELYLFLLS